MGKGENQEFYLKNQSGGKGNCLAWGLRKDIGSGSKALENENRG